MAKTEIGLAWFNTLGSTLQSGMTASSTSGYAKSNTPDNMLTFAQMINDPTWNGIDNEQATIDMSTITSWGSLAEKGYLHAQSDINQVLRKAIFDLKSDVSSVSSLSSITAISYQGTIASHGNIPSDAINGGLYIATGSGTIAKTSTTSGKQEKYSAGDAIIVHKTTSGDTTTTTYSVMQVNVDDSTITSGFSHGRTTTEYFATEWIQNGTNHKVFYTEEITSDLSSSDQTFSMRFDTTSGYPWNSQDGYDGTFVWSLNTAKLTDTVITTIKDLFNKTSPSTAEQTVINNFKSIVESTKTGVGAFNITSDSNNRLVFYWTLGGVSYTKYLEFWDDNTGDSERNIFKFVSATGDAAHHSVSDGVTAVSIDWDKLTLKVLDAIKNTSTPSGQTADEKQIEQDFASVVGSYAIDTDLLDGYSFVYGIPTAVSTSSGIRTWTYATSVTTSSGSNTYTEASAGAGPDQ